MKSYACVGRQPFRISVAGKSITFIVALQNLTGRPDASQIPHGMLPWKLPKRHTILLIIKAFLANLQPLGQPNFPQKRVPF